MSEKFGSADGPSGRELASPAGDEAPKCLAALPALTRRSFDLGGSVPVHRQRRNAAGEPSVSTEPSGDSLAPALAAPHRGASRLRRALARRPPGEPMPPGCWRRTRANPRAAFLPPVGATPGRHLDPALALPHRGAVVAMTWGRGASLTTPPGCRHAPASRSSPSRAALPVDPGVYGPRRPRRLGPPKRPLPRSVVPKRHRPRGDLEPPVPNPGRRRAGPVVPRRVPPAGSPRPVPPSRPCLVELPATTEAVTGYQTPHRSPASAGVRCFLWSIGRSRYPSGSIRPWLVPRSAAGWGGLRRARR
jgi:hypothetical protein